MRSRIIIGAVALVAAVSAFTFGWQEKSTTFAQEDPPTVTSSVDLTVIDTDFDGCTDAEELGTKPRKGGMRDPNNPFDFFDVNFDRKVTREDAKEVAARYGAKRGDARYDLAYDRAQMGADPWDLGPGDGVINRADVNAVLIQLGDRCSGVPVKSFAAVCSELQTEARSEGFNEFSCSTDPLPAPSSSPEVGRKRTTQVSRLSNQTVVVDKLDEEVQISQTVQAMSSQALTAAAAIPASCYTAVCSASVTRKIELKHLFGFGPNCAWINFVQKWDVYYPYRAITSVGSPRVTSGATAPCAQDSRSVWLHREGMPFYADSGTTIHWKVGIPSPWGTLGFREFNPWIGLLFRGDYSAQWQ